MAIKIAQNPFESSFENLTTNVQGQVKKAKAGVNAVVQEAVGQVTGSKKTLLEETGVKKLPEQDKQAIGQTEAQNLARLNDEIDRIRKDRQKRQEEEKQQREKQNQQKKAVEEKKKKEDPGWLKALKGQTGSHEGPNKTG